MAPIKFEENIKQKLGERKMKPSDAAWERISRDLDRQAPKKRKNTWIWIAVAAGFIGILILAGSFFRPVTKNMENQIVAVPAYKNGDQKVGNPSEKIVGNQTVLDQGKADKPFGKKDLGVDTKVGSNSKNTRALETISKEESPLPHTDLANAEAEKITKNVPKTLKNPVKPNEKFDDPALNRSIDREVNALLATVDSLEKEDHKVSDAEVNALLAKAQQKLLVERDFLNGTEPLSAEALLREAEGDLDRSFRDRLFDALKEGYLKTRDALASRND